MKKIMLTFVVILLVFPVVGSSALQVHSTSDNSSGDLMDSAWPMFQHDNKHTGRSPYGVLGNTGVVKWKFNMSGPTVSSPAIDKNGTIYIGGSTITGGDNFYAINPDGSLKWSYEVGDWVWVWSSPALTCDGAIYVGSLDGCLYALSSEGVEKWRFNAGRSIFSSPAIADDGTVYFGSTNGKIYALNPDGSEKWHYTTENSIHSSAAIDDNGTVYIGSHDGCLYALKPNGTLLWKYKTKGCIVSPPTIADDGTIFFGSWDNYLYALYPNGTLKWKFNTHGSIQGSPAIDLEGNIYIGSCSDWFYCISPRGVENWSFKTGDAIWSSPIIDKYGIIYICSMDGNLYVLNPDGSIRWIFATGEDNLMESTPAIGEDGTIYICSTPPPDDYSYLYAINTTVVHKPSNPTITGPSSGFKWVECTFTASCFHQDGYNISYFFDWGDGTDSGWTDFVPSGIPVNASHTWIFIGGYKKYIIQVKAKDVYGEESDWSTFSVSIARTRSYNPIIQLIQEFLERFPFVEKILNKHI